MISGAIYELTRDKDNTQLGFEHIQFIERRKIRTITRTVVPDDLNKEKCGGVYYWLNHEGAQKDHTLKQATLTVDEYQWVVLGDGAPYFIDEDDWAYEVMSHYDFIAFAEGTKHG